VRAARVARDPERAAAELARAIAWAPAGSPASRALVIERAEALARASLASASAAAYEEAARLSSPLEAVDLRRRAAEQLFACGRADEAEIALAPSLARHAVAAPETSHLMLLALAARLVELRLRGASLPEAPRAARPDDRARLEALWCAAKGLSPVAPLRSAFFAAETLRAALAAGDTDHAARALAFAGALLAYPGGAAEEERGQALIDEAARFARRNGDGYLLGFAWCCSGLARLCAGRFREALARIDEGLRLLEDRGGDLAWERNACRSVSLHALFALGSLRERAARAEAWLAEARARDDRWGEAQAALALAFARITSGDPAGARALARDASALFYRGAFGLAHQTALWIDAASRLYEGDPFAASASLLASWPALREAHLLRFQLVRVDALLLRGAAAVAAASTNRAPNAELLRAAEADAASLSREGRPHALAAAAAIRAGVLRARGDLESAIHRLAEAARAWSAAEMSVHAAAAQRARGLLLGGDEGRALLAAADARLAREGVTEPARLTAMLLGILR
jgi:hypothetical protein